MKTYLLLVALISFNVVAANSDLIKKIKSLNFSKIKDQKKFYEYSQESAKFLKDAFNDDLLTALILGYNSLFKYNRSHFHLENFVAYYKKNRKLCDNKIKMLLTKKDQDEFFHRLNIAIRENEEGNG